MTLHIYMFFISCYSKPTFQEMHIKESLPVFTRKIPITKFVKLIIPIVGSFSLTYNGGINDTKNMEYPKAIRNAMDICIEQDILKDILLKSKSEVFHMLLTEYDEKKHLKNTYNEGYESGKQAGYEDGQIEGYKSAEQRMDKLIIYLERDGRIADIAKAARDSKYKEELFEEYNL